MAYVQIPATAPEKHIVTIDSFLGVDLQNAPANVADRRSPEAPNMMRDVPGKIKKRTGYHTIKSYGARINGRHLLQKTDGAHELIHAGDTLYYGDTAIYEEMNDARSVSFQAGGELFILDGKNYLCFSYEDAPNVEDAAESATVPVVIISRRPSGGGTSYEAINLLSDYTTDSFLGEASTKEYQLTVSDLSEKPVKAKKMDANGNWVELTEGTDFTVDRVTGKVTFVTAPGASPVDGKDNVQITAAKDRSEYRSRILGCDIGILYGVGGAADRLFVSGNKDFPNYDWYSGQNDLRYFGDLSYSVLGQDSSSIVGYSILSDKLCAHKDNAEDGRNLILRSGTLVDGKAAFPIYNTLQGEGTIAKHSISYLNSEPLFLTSLGVYAVTRSDMSGDRYAQNRSFYINKPLLETADLQDAFGFRWQDFYLLATKDRVYLLDGLQRSYEKNTPYSTYQYEAYYWENVPARLFWDSGGTLCFGDEAGNVCEFYADTDNVSSYNDNGEPIAAWWDLPDFSGKNFYQNKTIRYLAVMLAAAPATSIKLYAQARGLWKNLKEEMSRARFFSFDNITFGKFTFSNDETPKTLGMKIKVKKVDKARFRLLNSELNEPFGIYEVALEYIENGKYKGR